MALEQTRGVRRARVETNPDGVEAIRLLVIPERTTEAAISDALDVARSLHIDLDAESVQVIRAETAGEHRRKISSLSTERTSDRFRTKVMLELAGDVLVGESDAPAGGDFERRSTVTATLEGLREILGFPVDIDSVRILDHAEKRVALVTLTRGAAILTGTAAVDGDEHLALARATLDALNRFVTRT